MSQVVVKTASKMWKLKSSIILDQVVVANVQLQIAIAWVF